MMPQKKYFNDLIYSRAPITRTCQDAYSERLMFSEPWRESNGWRGAESNATYRIFHTLANLILLLQQKK